MHKKLLAEFFGTYWLVLGGCGAAVLAAKFPGVGIGLLGVALAFGLTVVTMAYAVGHISGAHFNPAITFGAWVAGRIPLGEVALYWIVQVLGGIAAASTLALIAAGAPGFDVVASGLASNGYAEHSPGQYSLVACFFTEVIMSCFFLLVILGATSKRQPAGLFAPLAIGLTLTLIHLISIPVTNTSVNPARSTGPALMVGGWAIHQLWLFWVAPLLGAAIGGLLHRVLEPQD